MFKVKFTTQAKKDLKKLSKKEKLSIGEVIEDLKDNPFMGKLLGRDLNRRYSYRVGVYRIIYKVNQKDNIIDIISAGHRSVVYN